MATEKRPASSNDKDSVTHAPESGEPTEMTADGSDRKAVGGSAKSKIGKPKVGEADES